VIAALRRLEQARAATIELRPQAAEAFDRELRDALAGTVWQTGCTSWYVDEQGNNPNNWPWTQTAYRRRAARIDPAAYELA
jgi:quinol monooxygenase YgiN